MALAYTQHAWASAEVITAAKLNNIEAGLGALLTPTIVTAAGPLTLAAGGVYIINQTVPAAFSLVLPAGPAGPFQVIDGKGDGNLKNIAVTVTGGGTINNQSTIYMDQSFMAITFYWTGTQYCMS